MCGESWLATLTHRPSSQDCIQVSLAIYVCLSGSWLGGLPLYFSYASVLSTCTRKPIAT